MKILNIKLCNYGSYVGEHFISLIDRGLVLIQGINKDEPKMDSNGAGKSCIPDSLDWCINGKIPRGDHIDSIINDNCTNCYVEVQIESDTGDMILIRRERSRKGNTVLQLLVNDDNQLTKLDIKETQKAIYDLLGIDGEIFHSTILFAQTNLVHYADSTDAKRMEILTKLSQLEFVDNLLEKVKYKQNELLLSEQRILGNKQTIDQIISSLQGKNYTVNIQDWENSKSRSIEFLRIKENELQIKNDAIQLLDKVECEIRIQELQTQVANLSKPDESIYKSYLARQLDINKQLAVVDKELSDIINKQQYLNYTMNNGNYYCDSCGQLVTIEHLQKEYSKLENLFSVKTSEFHNIKNRLDTIDGSIRTELRKIEREKALFLDNSVKLKAEIQEQLNAISDIDKNNKLKNSIQNDIIFIQNRIKEESNKINPWISIQQEDNLKLDRCNNDLLQINQQLDSIITLKECYTFWIKALGPKGLKSYILDTKLSELNASINYWVKLLTDGTIWVELGSYKKGRGKKIINSPEVNICRWASDDSIISRNYRSWSGGEKQRISIAIDLGLSSIISRRSTKQYNLLILDEIFRHLDSGGKYAVMDMLQLLAKDKDSIFIIDHDPDFQSLFENRITVIKENGQSNLVEDTFNEDKRYKEETNSLISSRAHFKRRAIRNTI